MCGIAGIKLFNNHPSKSDEANLLAAIEKQTHRGPDNLSHSGLGNVLFGHNRLSIIDTSSRSNQPFVDETNRYILVFNGEIYNFHELKNELIAEGIQFKTSSDTEVLFNLLIRQKADTLERLRGCFAFAFYDQHEDYLLLARDRMGINPLLYSVTDESLIFGSELFVFKDLYPDWKINHEALNYYFQYTYIPAPLTIVEGVNKLLPGHYLECRGSTVKISRYWDPKAEKAFSGDYEDAKKELRRRLQFAVESQLEADVPVGTFLSGGIDSSLVSAIAKKHKPDLHTFSVSFGDQEAYDESKYALLVSKHIKSQHHVIRLTESDFKSGFQQILDSFDEPFADSSAIAMWFLSKETVKYVKVALSGDGADELLAGYNKHLAILKAAKLNQANKLVYSVAEKLLRPYLSKKNPKKFYRLSKFNQLSRLSWKERYLLLAANIGEKAKNKLLRQTMEVSFEGFPAVNSLNDFLYLDQLIVLPNDMLKKVDLMSMSQSLEVRTPFMDKDLVKFINSLPEKFKHNGKTGKLILREACSNLLPEEIFTRSKQGFEVPIYDWIKNSWDSLVPDLWFDQKSIEKQSLFNYNTVLQLKERFFRNEGTASQEMWAYFVFQNWYFKHYAHA